MITALCGGVGGSKLALGLYRILPPHELTVLVNTADDLEFCGLHVSPDLDTVTYTLAGLARRDVGWGLEGDTFSALELLGQYGVPTWFQVGDRDLATHVYRTQELRRGASLTMVTSAIAAGLGVRATVVPMSDDPVATRLEVDGQWIAFQDYFVRLRHSQPVGAVVYEGIERAAASPSALAAIEAAEVIVLVNSNPVLSLLPILSVPGIRPAIERADAVVAVSPIVGSGAVSGPAGELMRLIGQPSTAAGVAAAYDGLLAGMIIDRVDADQVDTIAATGVAVRCTDTIMRDDASRERLAAETIDFARSLR
ncbi:MAG TPA: 2-phospho-L-lactate transferase [Chloroflexota bacterium]|nr:2-phospho-L-lactate transferase [Chloroflexota bacterium]